jgi:hypothetical protein
MRLHPETFPGPIFIVVILGPGQFEATSNAQAGRRPVFNFLWIAIYLFYKKSNYFLVFYAFI